MMDSLHALENRSANEKLWSAPFNVCMYVLEMYICENVCMQALEKTSYI